MVTLIHLIVQAREKLRGFLSAILPYLDYHLLHENGNLRTYNRDVASTQYFVPTMFYTLQTGTHS